MTNTESGLTDDQVVASRSLNGANVLPSGRRTRLAVLFEVITEPMLLLLGATAVLYFITGQYREGAAMIFAMVVVAGISVYQELRSEHALESLRKMVRPAVKVVRNGIVAEILVGEVVVGDIVQLSEGEQMPADGELVLCNDLSFNEALLTGESFPVFKTKPGDPVYAGTTVLSGAGSMIVRTVGTNTRLGQLGRSLEEIVPVRTRLQQQIRHFTRWMAFIGILAFLIVWLVNYLESRDVLHSLFHGLTLAMAVLPEEIPVAVSTFMALGSYRMIGNRVLVRHVNTVEALGAATVICVDKTGTITRNSMTLIETVSAHANGPSSNGRSLLLIARLACEQAVFDPMERAIEKAFNGASGSFSDFKMVHEYPLGGRFPIMTHVYRTAQGNHLFAAKGSPEGILEQSRITAEERIAIEKSVSALAAKGYRVLAVASREQSVDEPMPQDQFSLEFEYCGLLAFSDPVKENIPEVIKSFHEAGISVKMITGDHPSTACHIAAVAGLLRPNRFLTGEQVNAMTEQELAEAVHSTDVFARSMPETKLRIIRALKGRGETVAMTGDGVNDAPALKAADIGISMGKRGSEVARQASSLVLLDDDLNSMVFAVGQGRRIYSNLKKAIRYIVSIHVPILCVVLLPLLLGWEYVSIFTPVHVIFLEMVMGPTCSIVFESEPAEPDAMRKSPRAASVTFLTWKELSSGIIRGLVIATAALLVIGIGQTAHWGEGQTRTIVFLLVVCANIFLTISARSDSATAWSTLRWRNPLLFGIHAVTVFFLILAVSWQPLRTLFGFQPVSMLIILSVILFAFVAVFWWEPFKLRSSV